MCQVQLVQVQSKSFNEKFKLCLNMLPKPNKLLLFLLWMLCVTGSLKCDVKTGPDPWNYEKNDITDKAGDDDIPPDLRLSRKIKPQTDNNYGTGEWFYRRILSIMLKGGQVQKNEDGSVDISLQMKLDQKQWDTLNGYLTSSGAFSEDMFRRSLGYVEQCIYEPSLPTKIILAWSDYIQITLTEYKTEMKWTLAALGISALLFWMWRHMSHTSVKIIIFICLYLFEVFVSYKEAEQKELDTFVAALNSCKWRIWSSNCEVPRPDPLVFIKHMNPTKIGVRMFTNLVSEPLIVLSDTAKTMTHGITDGIWYPFDVIVYGIFVTFFNVLLLLFMIMIIFNFLLNIPFKLDFLLFSVGLLQRKKTKNKSDDDNQKITQNNANNNAISAHTLDKLLDVFSKALNRNADNQAPAAIQHLNNKPRAITSSATTSGLKRSASTGRLPNPGSFECHNEGNVTRRNVPRTDGGGDAR